MSTPLGVTFAQSHGGAYNLVLEKWGASLKGVTKITDEMKAEWVADLRQALEADIIKALMDEPATQWQKVGKKPSEETLTNLARLAAKSSFSQDHYDLLTRLSDMADESEPEEIDAGSKGSLTAAIRVSEAIKRVPQTIAQIFDMVKDRFDGLMERHHRKKGELTGRRRWRTSSMSSRHRSLNYRVKDAGENFNYNGDSITGPRPPGGSPKHWSGCSCYLELEKTKGGWVRV